LNKGAGALFSTARRPRGTSPAVYTKAEIESMADDGNAEAV